MRLVEAGSDPRLRHHRGDVAGVGDEKAASPGVHENETESHGDTGLGLSQQPLQCLQDPLRGCPSMA